MIHRRLNLLYLLLILFSCHIDSGLEPINSGFKGTIYFENNWPEDTDQVMVVASTVFPPTQLSELTMSDPLPLFVDSVQYTLYTNPSEFAAIGVVWKQKDQAWDVTNIIGMYFPTTNRFAPGKVIIPDRKTMVDSINMQADLEKAKPVVSSSISGKLFIKGEWPESAQSVLVVASPSIIPSGLLDVTFGQPISAGFDSTSYSFTIQPGDYKLIAALIIEINQNLGLKSIRGIYFRNPNDFVPGTVSVPTRDSKIDDIDITIDFTKTIFTSYY